LALSSHSSVWSEPLTNESILRRRELFDDSPLAGELDDPV
jgi:hypothetical protein